VNYTILELWKHIDDLNEMVYITKNASKSFMRSTPGLDATNTFIIEGGAIEAGVYSVKYLSGYLKHFIRGGSVSKLSTLVHLAPTRILDYLKYLSRDKHSRLFRTAERFKGMTPER